ncbi:MULTISPECIES: daptide-type RiPP biosynthesis aminotransferase [unclassified Streptomyces]|uniref:daptide-type RiPP biosynthesis aminotransferase n=1 Tax=unclassified Streptomyces TaxID=2593676 RepID=UPI002E2C5D47|nr:daptide-type RiPP biosynthesis aminotransferase [Streptomyces sp. NBC_00223]
MTGTLWPMMMPLADADDDGICVVRTSGHRITFADGNTVLCGTSGLWNANLGYGNQAISAAVADALGSLSYAGVFRYENAPARTAAERLIAASAHDWARVIFSVSGGTANDLTMKLARQYHELGGDPARKLVVGLKDGYHGLTFGAHALTGEDLGQRAYGVDTRLVRHVPANDETALKALFAAFGRQIAAIVVEPVLGNGAVVLEAGYVEQLGRFADETGALLVADEVATGFGRTGGMFASDGWTRQPDVLIASKGLTNGTMPASALLIRDRVADRFRDTGAVLLHGETQAGTAVTAAAVIATLDEFERLGALESGRTAAAALDAALTRWQSEDPAVLTTCGTGCFRAVVLADPVHGGPLGPVHVLPLVREIRRAGAQVHGGPNGVQLLPALTYSPAEIDELVSIVRDGVAAFSARVRREASAG